MIVGTVLEFAAVDTQPLAALDTMEGYRRLFTDVGLWSPFVETVLRKHDLEPRGPVRLGIPGTCPAFAVGERWVVKFFGRLFDGGRSFATEREAARLTALDPRIRAVPAAAVGTLGGAGWPWPYLVFPFIKGTSIGAAAGSLPYAARLTMAAELGEMIRRLHALPVGGSPVFANTHAAYRQFLEEQRAGLTERLRAWGSLPERLIEAAEVFVPVPDALMDLDRPPHLIHADLTGDHLLGEVVGSGQDSAWHTNALIDFGDARTGDLLYELGPLQLDLFGGDRGLLGAFLDAYGLPPARREALPEQALATALLHQFDLFGGYAEEARAAADLADLADLAQRLFGAPVSREEDRPARRA